MNRASSVAALEASLLEEVDRLGSAIFEWRDEVTSVSDIFCIKEATEAPRILSALLLLLLCELKFDDLVLKIGFGSACGVGEENEFLVSAPFSCEYCWYFENRPLVAFFNEAAEGPSIEDLRL